MQRRQVLALLLTAPMVPARAARLSPSGPVRSSGDGQVIENLDIQAQAGDALLVTHRGVTVRRCRIRHAAGHGVHGQGADGLVLQDLEILRAAPPAPGTQEHINCYLERAPGATLTRIRAARGSSNIYLEHSPDSRIRSVELHDARGPFPRGQNVQISWSPRSLLEDFSGENGSSSWTEDLVSVFCSDRCTVRRGLVSYNNGPTGDGVMLEGSSDCLVHDVDAVEQGNGAFAAVPIEQTGSGGCVFLRCRTRASYNASRDGRPAPESNGLSFYMQVSPGARRHTIADCHYDRLANPRNLIWDASSVNAGWSITGMAFQPRPPIRLDFAWSRADGPA